MTDVLYYIVSLYRKQIIVPQICTPKTNNTKTKIMGVHNLKANIHIHWQYFLFLTVIFIHIFPIFF